MTTVLWLSCLFYEVVIAKNEQSPTVDLPTPCLSLTCLHRCLFYQSESFCYSGTRVCVLHMFWRSSFFCFVTSTESISTNYTSHSPAKCSWCTWWIREAHLWAFRPKFYRCFINPAPFNLYGCFVKKTHFVFWTWTELRVLLNICGRDQRSPTARNWSFDLSGLVMRRTLTLCSLILFILPTLNHSNSLSLCTKTAKLP